jgi:NitT/TauT family transport system substrate-binding protein
MMGEVAKLIGDGSGKLDTATYDRTVKALLDQKIISKKPEGAFTADITAAALK